MEDEQLLEALESAYNRGVTLEQMQGKLSDDAMIVAQDFFSKKKDGTEGSQIASPSVLASEPSVRGTVSLSTQLDSDSKAVSSGLLDAVKAAQERGVTLEQMQGKLSDDAYNLASQYYKTIESQRPVNRKMKDHWLIIDENPSELGRLWNRAVSGGILANEIAEAEITGVMDYEKIAYLNNIVQRDAPKEEDYLYDTSNPVGSFVLDVIRTIPESLISMATAAEAGIRGAAAGAGVGAGAGSVIPGAGTAAGATTGAIAGYFGGTSLALEYGHSIMDVLREEGVDVTSPDQLREASRDQRIMSKAREKGLKRGIPIAVFDAISGGTAGKVGNVLVKSVGKSATNRAMKVAAAETLVQAGLGGTGEFAGQVISGEEIRPRDIALEAFAELGPAAPVMAYNLAGRIGKTPGELSYIDWAKEQDQKKLSVANEISFVANNGEIASIDNEIQKLRESKKKDPATRKAVDAKLQRLKQEKYSLLRETSERVMKLEGVQEEIADQLTRDINAAADVLKDGNITAEEKVAIEEEMAQSAKELDELLSSMTEEQTQAQPDDKEVKPEEVPGAEQVGEELGDVPKSETSRAKAQISGVLQAREEEVGRASRHRSVSDALTTFSTNRDKKKGVFFNLFDKNDAGALRTMLEEGKYSDGKRIPIKEQRILSKLVLASEAYRLLNPDSKDFNIGFGRKGYYAAGKAAGFKKSDLKTSAGITSGRVGTKDAPIVVSIPSADESLSQRGKVDRYTAEGTAYHEVYHKIFSKFFNDRPIDFNQFRKLVIRRLSESNVKELNDFAERYMEREDSESAGAYKSEEFMVQLGGLLGSERIVFEASFLEELKAFLNGIVSKITGQRVQIFEDAGLAKDISEYMKGMSKAVRAGADISQVPMAESLQTERFQRERPTTTEKTEKDEYGFEKPTGEMDVEPSKNVAGIPDPENYDKTFDPLEKLTGILGPKLNALAKKLEKVLGIDRLRGTRRDVLQALEISESINVQHINRYYLAMRQIDKITNKLPDEQRQEASDLSKDYLFGAKEETRREAFDKLQEINPELVKQLGRLRAIRASMQESIQNSAVFDNLSSELQETIIDNTASYGTRTYRAFTDPNFKFDPQLRAAAEKSMVDAMIYDMAYDIYENESLTDEQFAEMEARNLDVNELDDIAQFIELTQIEEVKNRVKDSLRNIEAASRESQGRYGEGLAGSKDLGKLRIPTKKLKQRQDLPIELMDYMGVEKDPYIKFSQTIATLTNMVQQFTLVDRVNEIAQRSDLGDLIVTTPVVRAIMATDPEKRLGVRAEQFARDLGLIGKEESFDDFYTRTGGELIDGQPPAFPSDQIDYIEDKLKDYFIENYTVIEEKKSPMSGKAVKNDFVSMLKQTPMYQSDNKVLQGYYKLLLQMRRVRVLYNLPTWRKNIMGGWYFLGANFVLPFNKHRGGLTAMEDLRNRFKKMKDGELDPEYEKILDRMGELGLLGSSPNMGMFSDINDSFIQQLEGVSPELAWKWLPAGVKKAQRELGVRAARTAYQYGFIDDYTKMIAYLTKRENFAKRLESNPEGKSYAELSFAQKQQVDEMTAERIKQNMPTMSRIHPSLRNLFKLPVGDFLSFRVEAFRSFFSIYRNAVADLGQAMTNENLTKSQRGAYMTDGAGTLGMGLALAGLSKVGYQAIAGLLLKDDEEDELGQQARSTNYVLPPWMQGSNIVAVDMGKDGKIRFANMSSEDPYDELQGLIYGRNGISRSNMLQSIAADFKDPNLAARLLFNLVDGKDSYGRPILNNEDVGWFHRYIIGPNLTEWSDAYGSYIFKETFIPPNMNYIAREYRKRMKEAKENPDIELQPLETAAELSSALIFRDYPVDISRQFYYNMSAQNFRKPYTSLSDNEKINRQVRLDEIKRAYQFAANYSAKFGNYSIISSVESTIDRTFAKSPEEAMYIKYDLELPK